MKKYLLSIITPVLNVSEKIEKTLVSTLHPKIEHIIVDGGSSDNTEAIVKKHIKKRGDQVKWIIESKNGIYPAMNRGVLEATGDFVLFLGGGDELITQNIDAFLAHLNSKYSIVYGNLKYPSKLVQGRQFSIEDLVVRSMLHPAMAYKKSIWHLYQYNARYKIAADHIFNIQCMGDNSITFHYVPLTITLFEGGGISDNGVDEEFVVDQAKIIKNTFGPKLYNLFKICGREFNSYINYGRRFQYLIVGDNDSFLDEVAGILDNKKHEIIYKKLNNIDNPKKLGQIKQYFTEDTRLVIASKAPEQWLTSANNSGIDERLLLISKPAILTPSFLKEINDLSGKIVICGSGAAAKAVLRELSTINDKSLSIIVVDKSHEKVGNSIENHLIILEQQEAFHGASHVIIASMWTSDVRKRLRMMGVSDIIVIDAVYGNNV